MFEWLPLITIIDKRICCIHSGIGSSNLTINDVEQIPRPIKISTEVQTQEQQMVVDLLWSDPAENDTETGIQPHLWRDQGTGNIVKFGADIVEKFLKTNNLSLIIRSHQSVADGFENFSDG